MEIKKIAVFQTWGIGDLIMAMPMLVALRKKLPLARISLVVRSHKIAEILDKSLVDEIVIIPLNKGFLSQLNFFIKLRQKRFDMAIICTRISYRLAMMLGLVSGIKIIAGDSNPKNSFWYAYNIPTTNRIHRVEQNLAILREVFPEVGLEKFSFKLDNSSTEKAEKLWKALGLKGKKVLGIHPGAASNKEIKCYPKEKFVNLIKLFLRRFKGARVLVFIGPQEKSLKNYFLNLDRRVIIIEGLSIKVVAGILSKLKVFLGNDSGLGHVAALLDTPTITLAGPTNITATKPYGRKGIIIKTKEELECMPCYNTKLYNKCKDVRCMETIKEEEILKKLNKYF